MSTSFTALALMQLVEKGQMSSTITVTSGFLTRRLLPEINRACAAGTAWD